MIEVAKPLSYNQNLILQGLSSPVPVLYKILILLNNSETTWPIFTKFHADLTVETGLRVCSNGHAPLTHVNIWKQELRQAGHYTLVASKKM